jgi:uncharacterized membrane protein
MRLVPAGFIALALAGLVGCNNSPPGGATTRSSYGAHTSAPGPSTSETAGDKHATFTIAAPSLATHMKQGETKTVAVSLHRGSSFHDDVTLRAEPAKGLKVDPTETVVKSSDKADDIPIHVTADKDAAIGDHEVRVTGTPAKGAPTSVDIKITVSKP